ncbi:hypothetical protein ACIRU3_25160 [Streptomyces sp. NPDC101151]|uniref:hypothetical protein n=1 Tax=Streptomyces sp. NPDC101151 TaxID=3366115 RepID=UPI0038148FC8
MPVPPDKDIDPWPGHTSALKAAADAYTAHMARVALDMDVVLGHALGRAAGSLPGRSHRTHWTQHLTWHPPAGAAVDSPPWPRRRPGQGVDTGAFTIRSPVPEMQAWNAVDGWFSRPSPAGCLVVTSGSLMQRRTGGRRRATRHRILAPVSAPEQR